MQDPATAEVRRTVTLANPTTPAEAALAAFEPARLRRIVDAVGDGITVQAADGRIVYANDAAARATGFESGEAMIAAKRDDILARFDLVDEAGAPLAPADLPGATVLRGGGEGSRLVGFRIRETGEERWALVSATALRDARGRVEYAINAFQDVTDRKRAELELDAERARLTALLAQRLADEARLAELIRSERSRAAELDAIISAIGEGIVVADRDGVITLANRTARQLLEPFEEARLAELLARFQGLAQDDDGKPPHGTSLAKLEGVPPRWVEISAYPVRPGAEQGEETILVLRDVTEARERDQAREAFIGMLSHELRTPVTTIYGGAKVLARPGLAEAIRREIFEDVHGEAERLHRLVEDVVALTRFGEGALDIGSEPVLLQRILPAVVRSEEGRWPGGSFELELSPRLPPVSGDVTYVEQVVRNLLANAVKYGGSGSRVVIAARAEGAEVEVRVLDEGPGFPDADARKLFDLYYRAPSTAQKVSGSGIGLFVCSRLIEAMGGRMWAANRPSGGAEFGFALSVIAEEA